MAKTELTLKDKALICIDYICLMESRQDDKEMDMIYEFAHAAMQDCPNPHTDWVQRLEKFFDDLVKQGEYHYDHKEQIEKLLD